MTQNRDLRATVGYKVDQQSVKAAADANAKVQVSFGGVQVAASAISAEFLKLNPQLAALVTQEQAAATAGQQLAQAQSSVSTSASRLTSSLNSQKAPVQDLTALYKSLEDQARRAGQAQDVAANSGQTLPGRNIGGTGISSGFGTLRSLAGAAGLVAGNTQAGSTIAAFAGLASVLGPVGIGIAAVGVGLRLISDNADRAAKAMEDTATAFAKVREAALKSTRADLQQQLSAAQDVEQERKKVAKNANDALLAFVNDNPEFTYPLTGIAMEWVSGLGGTLGGLQAEATNAEAALTSTQNEIAALTAVLGENGTAAYDATQAALAQANLALQIDEMTQAEREKEMAANLRQIDILSALANQAGAGTDTYTELRSQIEALLTEYEQLAVTTGTYADVLEREKEAKDALIDSSDAINDGLKDIAAAAQDVRQAQEAVADIQAKLVEADAEARQKSLELARDNDERVLEAQADAEEKRSEIAADAAERRQEIETDDAERRAEILKRFNTDYSSAVASRDALSAHKAKQTRDEELDKQSKAYRKQLDQLDKQMEKQLAAVDKALDKQLRNIQKQFERQQASIDDAYNKQYRNLQDSLNEALAAEQFANNRLESLRSENASRAEYWAGVVETANKRLADSHAALAVSVAQSALLVASVTSGRATNGQSGNALVGGVGGGSGGIPPLSDASGNILARNVSRPNLSGLTSNGISPMRMPAMATRIGGNTRNVSVVFAPQISAAGMSENQFERMSDRWFDKIRRAVE